MLTAGENLENLCIFIFWCSFPIIWQYILHVAPPALAPPKILLEWCVCTPTACLLRITEYFCFCNLQHFDLTLVTIFKFWPKNLNVDIWPPLGWPCRTMGESMEEEGGGYKVGQIYFCLSKKVRGANFFVRRWTQQRVLHTIKTFILPVEPGHCRKSIYLNISYVKWQYKNCAIKNFLNANSSLKNFQTLKK